MKKINMVEAAQVIGGCEDVCLSKFVVVNVQGGPDQCVELTSCTDKHGKSTNTYKGATLADCGIQ